MKQCKKEGCYQNVFSNGFCCNHQYLRTDKKVNKKISYKSQKKSIQDFSFGFENQIDLFNWCWEKAKNEKGRVICQFTGIDITDLKETNMWYSCFAHVLPKGRYTYWKLNPENIRVVAPLFHQFVDQSTALQREKHPEWKYKEWISLVFEMKLKYQDFKKQNQLS
jgi:hypothetical protein